MASRRTQPTAFDLSAYEPALLQHLNDFLDSLTARGQSQGTISKRRNCIHRFIHFMHQQHLHRYQDVAAADLQRYRTELNEQGYSTHSIYSYLISIRQLYTYLEAQSLLFENPTANIILAKPKVRLGLVLTEPQVKTLLRQPDLATPTGVRDRAIIELLYSTGIRLAECAALTIFDADSGNRTVKVLGKGNKERILPLGKHAAKYLRLYMKEARPRLIRDNDPPEQLWLSHRNAHPLCNASIRVLIQKHAQAADLPTQTDTHTLRRTCASHLLKGGAHPVAVAHLLGHRDLGTLAHYLKTTITDITNTHAQSAPGK